MYTTCNEVARLTARFVVFTLFAMGDDAAKLEKKRAKAEVKRQKAEAKAATSADGGDLPQGVSVSVQQRGEASDLIVSGLRDDQLKRLLPDVTREVLITVEEEKNPVRAMLLRFIREGIFQTIVKIVAGLIVGILLIKFGLN